MLEFPAQQFLDKLPSHMVVQDEKVRNTFQTTNPLLEETGAPALVLKPGSMNDLKEILKAANETGFPLVPVSSEPFHEKGGIAADQDLPRVFAVFIGQNGLAGRRVKRNDGRVDAERHVNPFAHGYEPARQMGRPALEGIQMGDPLLDVPLPQDHAVERIARDQPPAGGQVDRSRGTLVDDVEQTSPGRDHGG